MTETIDLAVSGDLCTVVPNAKLYAAFMMSKPFQQFVIPKVRNLVHYFISPFSGYQLNTVREVWCVLLESILS